MRRRVAGRGPAVALTATPRGQRVARRVLDAGRAALTDALTPLSPTEARVLTRVLERALDGLADRPGTTICRRCDTGRCRGGPDGPVEGRQVALGVPPPPFVAVDDGED